MPLTDLVHYLNGRNRERYGALLCPTDSLTQQDGHIVGHFAGLRLNSAYQPLVEARGGKVTGHEALLRATSKDGQAISPEAVFVLPCDSEQIVFLDRLCRTVHALNFLLQTGQGGGDLYLNIHPRHLLAVSAEHGLVFEAILKRCGLTPERVVLEILESAIDDTPLLAEAVAGYRSRGYRIAIDDFGRNHSNFDRLWQLEPDVVKLDRSLISTAETNPRVRRILPKLTDIVRELGAKSVFEGIENREQLAIAIDSGADLLQGYYLARPRGHCLEARSQLVNQDVRVPFVDLAGLESGFGPISNPVSNPISSPISTPEPGLQAA